jgi:hypothetical protein
MGVDLPATGWHEKASVIGSLLRRLATIYTMRYKLEAVSWKGFFEPSAVAPTLTPLGAPRLSGLSRRPRWLSGTTPEVVASNMWKCLKAWQAKKQLEQGARRPARGEREEHEEQVTRTLTKGWRVDRTGFKQVLVWKTRAEKELAGKCRETLDDYYKALDAWQRNPVGPIPRHPSTRTPPPRTASAPPPGGG